MYMRTIFQRFNISLLVCYALFFHRLDIFFALAALAALVVVAKEKER